MPLSKQEAELPLFGFFKALRKSGFVLGIDDYALLWESWNGGFGLENSQELYRLCRSLWFKPGQSIGSFEALFKTCWKEIMQQAGVSDKDPVLPKPEAPRPELTPNQPTPSVAKAPEVKPLEQENSSNKPSPEAGMQYVSLRLGGSEGQKQQLGALPAQEVPTFMFHGRYQPINPRQASLTLGFLRQKYQKPGSEELDLDATIESIARDGHFFAPVMKPTLHYRNDVLLLVDHGGSMVAFHAFGDLLATALPGEATTLYFHDVPEGYLYRDPVFSEGISFEELKGKFKGKKPPVLIFSDGGAARGKYEPEMVRSMARVIQEIQPFSGPIAWVNPVPQNRWEKTSAQYLNTLVAPMFEANEAGLAGAVRVLRGKGRRSANG